MANQIKRSWNAASFSKCDSANAKRTPPPPDPAALHSTAPQLPCPLAPRRAGHRIFSWAPESSPLPRRPVESLPILVPLSSIQKQLHIRRNTCESAAEDRSIRRVPLRDRRPRVWHIFGRKLSRRNYTKPILVNNLFPYLALDFWEKAQGVRPSPNQKYAFCFRSLTEHGFRASLHRWICNCDGVAVSQGQNKVQHDRKKRLGVRIQIKWTHNDLQMICRKWWG